MEQKLLKRVEEANSLRKKGLDIENEIKEFSLNPENSHIFLLWKDRDRNEFSWMLMDGTYDEYVKFTLTFSANEQFMNATDPAQAISRSDRDFNSKMEWWTEQVQNTSDQFLKIQKLGLSLKETLWKQYASTFHEQIAAVELLWKLKGCDYLADHVREVMRFLREKDLIFSWEKGFENDMTIVFKVYSFLDTLNLNLGKRRVAQFLGFITFSTKSIKNIDWNCSKNCSYSCYCKPSSDTPRWTIGRPYSSDGENVRSGHRCGIDKANFKEWLKFTFSKVFKEKKIDGMEPSLKNSVASVLSEVIAEETAEEQKAIEEAQREFEEAARALQEKKEALERVQKRRKIAVE